MRAKPSLMKIIAAKALDYFQTRVNLWDRWQSRKLANEHKLRIGWCSVFPPTPNGVAVLTYYFLQHLLRQPDIECYAIPVNGRLDRRLFSGIRYAAIGAKWLDAVVVFCMGDECQRFLAQARTHTMIWQTVHDPLIEQSERLLFEGIRQADADQVIVVSRWAQQQYQQAGLTTTRYLPAAVDTNFFQPLQASRQGFNVLFVGRAEYYKGIVPFLEAMPLVVERYPQVRFLLHSPVTSRHLDPRIAKILSPMQARYPQQLVCQTQWTGAYGTMAEKYQQADLLVLPSNNEGFGVPLIEAMSCGVPCVVLDKPPMNEIVIDGQTGFCLGLQGEKKKRYAALVASGDYYYKDYQEWALPEPEDIAAKISWCIEHPVDYRRMSRAARLRIQEEYDVSKRASELVNLVRALVTSHA